MFKPSSGGDSDSEQNWLVTFLLIALSLLGFCVALTLSDAIEETVTWAYGSDYKARTVVYWTLFGILLVAALLLTVLYLRATRHKRTSAVSGRLSNHEQVEQQLSNVLPGSMLIPIPTPTTTPSTTTVVMPTRSSLSASSTTSKRRLKFSEPDDSAAPEGFAFKLKQQV